MEANELRIGNLVEWSRQHDIGASPEIVQIYNVALSSIRVYTDIEELPEILIYYDDVKPIPLTPEWLERARFEKKYNCKDNQLCLCIKNYFIYIEYQESWGWVYCVNHFQVIPLKHVHQLQNIVFALTGNELEFII